MAVAIKTLHGPVVDELLSRALRRVLDNANTVLCSIKSIRLKGLQTAVRCVKAGMNSEVAPMLAHESPIARRPWAGFGGEARSTYIKAIALLRDSNSSADNKASDVNAPTAVARVVTSSASTLRMPSRSRV
jgi:hypothetical protein